MTVRKVLYPLVRVENLKAQFTRKPDLTMRSWVEAARGDVAISAARNVGREPRWMFIKLPVFPNTRPGRPLYPALGRLRPFLYPPLARDHHASESEQPS